MMVTPISSKRKTRSRLLVILMLFISISSLAALKGERYAREGMDYYSRGDYEMAEQQFQQANDAAQGQESEYLFWLAQTEIALAKPQQAYQFLQQYVKFANAPKLKEARSMMDILDHQKLIFEEINLHRLPHYVNSRNSDFAPFVSHDGKTLYFTSLRPAEEQKENIWKVERLASVWGKPVLVKEFSTDKNESFGCLSNDGKTAYLFGNYQKGKQDGDIYWSQYVDGWSKPTPVPVINSDQIDLQPYLAQDQYLFFTSSRAGGFGGTDLYISERKGNTWTEPINLGPQVNTKGNEQTAFLDWDGKTLYFASDGHEGFGGYDVFKVVKLGDKWTEWSIPENLGLPVNSVKDDRYYFTTYNSNEAFISSERDNKGFENMYTLLVKMAPREYLITEEKTGTKKVVQDTTDVAAMKAKQVQQVYITARGKITDENGNPMIASIQWTYLEKDKILRQVTTSLADGVFQTRLPKVPSYQYTVNKEGYFMLSGTAESKNDNSPLQLDLVLKKMESKKVFVFNNIQFKFDSSVLTDESYPIVDEIAATLINNPELKVELGGHTCNVGPQDYNQWLSERRAARVVDYLVSKGVEASRLTSKGYGMTKPMVDNKKVSQRYLNRRTEVKVLE